MREDNREAVKHSSLDFRLRPKAMNISYLKYSIIR